MSEETKKESVNVDELSESIEEEEVELGEANCSHPKNQHQKQSRMVSTRHHVGKRDQQHLQDSPSNDDNQDLARRKKNVGVEVTPTSTTATPHQSSSTPLSRTGLGRNSPLPPILVDTLQLPKTSPVTPRTCNKIPPILL
eukprot:TRINITY_DN6064_c0_g1_i7.p1 TRINITY_DN6064_c0_g1~~TRINITY_DN6064_c0_g1_i7.p1  ORF type:complete len:140 (-),score=29.38 TRINITY_DN6064_c0_g1_i7:118-537(-)